MENNNILVVLHLCKANFCLSDNNFLSSFFSIAINSTLAQYHCQRPLFSDPDMNIDPESNACRGLMTIRSIEEKYSTQ